MENSPDNMSVLLQFAKFSKGFRISDFDDFVQEFIGVENLDFFGRLAYPNQWQIRLTDPDLRERLIRTGRTRIKNRSCWMYPLNQQEIRGFVHWLPNSVTNDQLREQLQLYGDVLFVESQERIIRGRNVESDHRYFGLILPYGTIKEDLPHFLKINGFLCLVVVRGREPACYHCKEVGHRRAECPKYKAKLISYCNREPNTAPPRLRPRGRRHLTVETEVRAETYRNEVSSSDDIVCLEREVAVAELITEPQLSASEDLEHLIEAQGVATGSTEKKLAESDVLAQSKAKSCIDSSAASFSDTQTKDILETIQQIQRRTKEDLQQRFKNFEKEIALTFTRGDLSTRTRDQRRSTATEATCKNLEQEMRNEELEMQAKEVYAPEESTTPVEMAGNDSNADAGMKETKGAEIRSDLPTMHQVKVGIAETDETFCKKSEEKPKYLQSTESTAKDPALLMLKETKQAASETFENTFKKLEEFIGGIKAPEKPSKDSATDTDSKLTEDDFEDLLGMLERAKAIAVGDSEETFKKIEANLYSQLSGESIDTEAKLTEDDICFAKQMLEKTKENTTKILQNTFKKLEEKVVKVVEQSQTTTESANQSKPIPKTENVITRPDATLEQLKQGIIDTVKHICKEDMEVVVETENSEKASSHDTSLEETIQIESDPVTIVQGDFEATEICERSEENKKVITEGKAFSERKGMESNVSKAVQEDVDKLQTNLKKIFASVQDKTELLPETRTILKQVESEVIGVVEETKNRWKMDIEDIFASFKVDNF
ncbi:hypothetical protein AVEN_121141-1 [Araneus ventricosus]|uniref:CCHC-type domain-containing protein n=1 Tax=Araneus ventricosus TaxID=182803 RepID=A0A4Y2E366_ARAVE|nr:hypothetical protein AVEN_121141-1 [Araneus ventricosus]